MPRSTVMCNGFNAWRRGVRRVLGIAAGAALAASLAACGGAGTTPVPISALDKRPLPAEFTTLQAVNYSPYRTSASEADLDNEVITRPNVEQDLRLIQAAGFGVIRLFSSARFGDTVLEVIRTERLNLKVMLGAYVVSPLTTDPATGATVVDDEREAHNQAELAATIRLANVYSDIVKAVSVGNETMVYWSTLQVPPEVMGRYIRHVRERVSQPVTTDDNWAFWAAAPKVITDVVDFAAVHTYPLLDTYYDPGLWDWRQKSVLDPDQRAAAMTAASIAEAKRQFGAARDFLDRIGLRDLPMLIGETGWVAVDTPGGPALPFRAHPVNQKLYFDALQQWVAEGRAGRGPQAVFFFQAFDEPWKQGDDGWGLFNKDRQARYVIQGRGTCGVTWACEAGAYTDADALHWVPPVYNDAVAATRYTLFSDVVTPGELRPGGLQWAPFATTGWGVNPAISAPGDGPNGFEINPAPVDFGWGLFLYSPAGTTENLSAFATGTVNFWIRTDNYPGRLEVGVFSDTDDRDQQEAFVQMAPGQYGYCNDNNWCQVSVPVQAFVAANPLIDLRLVTFRFVVADRYGVTGNSPATPKPMIYLDGIHWAR